METLNSNQNSTLFLICAEILNASYFTPKTKTVIYTPSVLHSYAVTKRFIYFLQLMDKVLVIAENQPNPAYKENGSFELKFNIKDLINFKDSIELDNLILDRSNLISVSKKGLIKLIKQIVKNDCKSSKSAGMLIEKLSTLDVVTFKSLTVFFGSKSAVRYARQRAEVILSKYNLTIKLIDGSGQKPGKYQIQKLYPKNQNTSDLASSYSF